jgi:hypothetical protein
MGRGTGMGPTGYHREVLGAVTALRPAVGVFKMPVPRPNQNICRWGLAFGWFSCSPADSHLQPDEQEFRAVALRAEPASESLARLVEPWLTGSYPDCDYLGLSASGALHF